MKWYCNTCGVLTKREVTEKPIGDQTQTLCRRCRQRVPRVIDLTQPMVCVVSVEVTEKMIEDDEIPF